MIITTNWLEEKWACQRGMDWFAAQQETDGVKVVKKLMVEKRFDWANWLIVRLMERKQYISYAIFAAEQVLDIFERKYPDDKRPRLAINAAKKCLEDENEINCNAASAAASAAAYAAAASAAASAAAYAASAAAIEKMQIEMKIINYGLEFFT